MFKNETCVTCVFGQIFIKALSQYYSKRALIVFGISVLQREEELGHGGRERAESKVKHRVTERERATKKKMFFHLKRSWKLQLLCVCVNHRSTADSHVKTETRILKKQR